MKDIWKAVTKQSDALPSFASCWEHMMTKCRVFIWVCDRVQQSSNILIETLILFTLCKFKGEWILLILFSFTVWVHMFSFSPLETFFCCADMHWNILPGLFSISLGILLVFAAWVDNFTHSLLLLSLTIWYLTSFAHPHLCSLCSWYMKRPFWLLMFAKVHEPQSSVSGLKMNERAGYLLGNIFVLTWPLMFKELNSGWQGICS